MVAQHRLRNNEQVNHKVQGPPLDALARCDRKNVPPLRRIRSGQVEWPKAHPFCASVTA